MNIINVLSVTGLFIASFIGYGREYMGAAGPSHFPFFITYIMIFVFALSYVLSLCGVSAGLWRLVGLLTTGVGLLITLVFSVMVLLGRASYPYVFHIPACYLQAALLLVLVYLWNKKK